MRVSHFSLLVAIFAGAFIFSCDSGGGGGSSDNGLVLPSGYAWVHEIAPGMENGYIFKSDGNYEVGASANGIWSWTPTGEWSINGGNLTLTVTGSPTGTPPMEFPFSVTSTEFSYGYVTYTKKQVGPIDAGSSSSGGVVGTGKACIVSDEGVALICMEAPRNMQGAECEEFGGNAIANACPSGAKATCPGEEEFAGFLFKLYADDLTCDNFMEDDDDGNSSSSRNNSSSSVAVGGACEIDLSDPGEAFIMCAEYGDDFVTETVKKDCDDSKGVFKNECPANARKICPLVWLDITFFYYGEEWISHESCDDLLQ
jgi:hypothetical protein